MDTKDITGLMEAYVAVYDEDLRDEIDTHLVQEDLSFIDDLSDNDLTRIMESIIVEGQFTLDECLDAFDGEYLYEARVTMGRGGEASSGRGRVTTSAAETREKQQERQRQRQERLRGAVERVKAAPGKAARKIGGKLEAGKQKIMGFLGRVGRAARAGAEAAKKEFSGQAEREARARSTGSRMRAGYAAGARRQATAAAAKDTSEFDRPRAALAGTMKKPDVPPPLSSRGGAMVRSDRGALTSLRTTPAKVRELPIRALPPSQTMSSRRSAAMQRAAQAAAGETTPGIRFADPEGRVAGGQVLPLRSRGTSSKPASRRREAMKFAKSVGLPEELVTHILEDLIQEGYAQDFEDAFEILEDLTVNEFENLVESYLDSEVEIEDHYDTVMDFLLDEGFAETEEDAEVIMANMSDDWRDEILDEANRAETELGFTSRDRERARNLNQHVRTPVFYKGTKRSRGDNSDPILNKAHKHMTGKRQAEHKARRGSRSDTGMPGEVIRTRYQANKGHTDGYPSITQRGYGPS